MVAALIAFVFAAWLASGPAPTDQPNITVEQLRARLAEASHERDAALAEKIRGVQLSERLTPATLAHIEETLHLGRHTREALGLAAASSVFLDPPAAEVPARAAPSLTEQQTMMNGAVHFVAVTLKRLPDFFATRTTQSFDDLPIFTTYTGWTPQGEMHSDGAFSQDITFRNGKEVVGRPRSSSHGKFAILSGLTSTGEFGSLQAVILRDVANGRLRWSHWETTPAGVMAVFQYGVPSVQSHYQVDYCCVRSYEDPTSDRAFAIGGIPNAYHGTPGYHGTMSVDPATGSIDRITIEALLKYSDPITDGGVAIEYGPVTIEGDKSYICPVHSVAISVTRSQMEGDFSPRMVRRINEVTFDNYHHFGATVKVVAPPGKQ